MGGILRHFDALLHFMCPSPNSIRRVTTDYYVEAYKVWGTYNKEAPIRTVLSSEEGVQHF